jgi:ketosteroid isomerase-like protein
MPLTISSRTDSLAADDVETVRRFFAAWSKGDLVTLAALADPQLEVEPLLGVLYEREVYRGPTGMAQAVLELAQRWDRFGISVESAEEAGEQVIAQVHLRVEKYDMSCEGHVMVHCTLRDGRVLSLSEEVPEEQPVALSGAR